MIYVVRHGETEENLKRIMQGHMPGTLTEKGRGQVREAAERLASMGVDFTRIVSSDLKRAMDSAGIIASRLGLEVVPMADLRERDWGSFTGQPVAGVIEKYCTLKGDEIVGQLNWNIMDNMAFPPDTVETEAEIYDRAVRALSEVRSRYAGENIILVTHGQFARNLLAAFEGVEVRRVPTPKNSEILILK